MTEAKEEFTTHCPFCGGLIKDPTPEGTVESAYTHFRGAHNIITPMPSVTVRGAKRAVSLDLSITPHEEVFDVPVYLPQTEKQIDQFFEASPTRVGRVWAEALNTLATRLSASQLAYRGGEELNVLQQIKKLARTAPKGRHRG